MVCRLFGKWSLFQPVTDYHLHPLEQYFHKENRKLIRKCCLQNGKFNPSTKLKLNFETFKTSYCMPIVSILKIIHYIIMEHGLVRKDT